MKKNLLIPCLLLAANASHGQQKKTAAPPPAYDSIAFHLYTDSLKRGQLNYINVDGRLVTGGWFPLGPEQLSFSSAQGRFEGNSLLIDTAFLGDSVMVTVTDKRNTALRISTIIYIKKGPDTERVKTTDEVLNGKREGNPSRRRNKKN